MSKFGHIYVSWRKGAGHPRHLIGKIKRSVSEGIVFEYLPANLADAKRDGFSAYTEFPDFEKKYTQGVVETFGQRIIKSERVDIQPFYNFWKIEPEKKLDPLYMLAMTQGWVPTDNFEFLADFQPTKDLSFVTDLAGVTSLQLKPGIVNVGDTLSYFRDSENKYDQKATTVYKGDLFIGYIKKIHNKVFCSGRVLKLKVRAIDQNGVIRRIFVSVTS